MQKYRPLRGALLSGLIALLAWPQPAMSQTADDDDDSIIPLITGLVAKDSPPAVAITSPTNGAQFINDTPVTLTATASDSDGTVRRVAFYASGGTTPICTATQSSSPYSCSYAFPSLGTVALTAVAIDNLGKSTTSATVNITIIPTSVRQYVYDALSRLTGVIAANGDAARYVYDPAGNTTRIDRFGSTGTALLGTEPPSGTAGATITLSGIGFSTTTTQNAVTFNGVAATVISATANQLVVTVPSGASTGTISVTTSAGTDTSAWTFTIQAPPPAVSISGFSPSNGTPGVTPVTISGANFATTTGGNEVKFNGEIATVSSATGTSITATVPANVTTGHITVRNSNGTGTSSSMFTVPLPASLPAASQTQTIAIDGSTVSFSPGIVAPASGVVLFDGTVGQNLGLGVSSFTGTGASVTVLRPDGTTLSPVSSVSAAGATLTIPSLPFTGTYAIVFAPTSGTANATFTLSNPLPGTIGVDGAGSSISSTRVGQSARYTFAGTAGKGYGITLQGSGASANPNMTVYQVGGMSLAAKTSISSSGPPVATTLAKTTGAFTVVVDPTSATPLSNLSVTVLNDALGTITYAGPQQTATVDVQGRATLLAFNLASSAKVNTYVYSTSGPYGIKIIDSTGSVVAPGTAVSGSYYVWIYPTGYWTGSVSAQLGIADLNLTGISVTNANAIPLLTHYNCTYYGISFTYTVANQGSIPASPANWQSSFTVSTQPDGTGTSFLLGNISSPGVEILPGNSVSGSGTFNHTIYFSWVTVGQTYYLVGLADVYGVVPDQNTTNNLRSTPIVFSNSCVPG